MAPKKIPRWQTPERRAYMKTWHAANPRDRREYKAAYDEAHRKDIEKYRAATQEKRKAYDAARYAANRESVLAKVKAYTEANHARVLAYHAEHYAANSGRLNAENAAYRKKHPEKVAHAKRQRYARKKTNGGTHTIEELLEKFALLGNACFYCGRTGKLTIDHDIPLVRGGTDEIRNILPACGSCNSRKRTRTAAEFLRHR